MTDWNSTLPALLAGYVPSGDDWTNIVSLLTALTDSWTDWSPTFTINGSVSNPTKGNSTYTSRYKRLGKTVHFGFSVTIGSTFTVGSGNYQIPLPFAPLTPATVSVGRLYVQKVGTGLYSGTLLFNSGTDTFLSMIVQAVTGGLLGSTGPGVAWGTGDLLQGAITYEAA